MSVGQRRQNWRKRERYKEGDEIANFLWMAVRTVVVVEDGPEAKAVSTGVIPHGTPEDDSGVVTSVDGPEDGSGADT